MEDLLVSVLLTASLGWHFTTPGAGTLTREIQLPVKPLSLCLPCYYATTRQDLADPWRLFRSIGVAYSSLASRACISDPLILALSFFHFLSPSISCFFSRVESSSLQSFIFPMETSLSHAFDHCTLFCVVFGCRLFLAGEHRPQKSIVFTTCNKGTATCVTMSFKHHSIICIGWF